MSALKNRIASLEATIRSRLPDLNLSEIASHGVTDESVLQPIAVSVTSANTQTPFHPPGLSSTGLASDTVGEPATTANSDTISHEIGLVSVGSSSDSRYIGPSSGYFLTRMLLQSRSRQDLARQQNHMQISPPSSGFLGELVEAIQGPLPLPKREHAEKICEVYFDVIHVQYPVLHQQIFMDSLHRMYDCDTPDPLAAFQVYMVLAIGSTVLSCRSKSRIPAESYCLSALRFFDNLNVENSIPGLQCLLLLMIMAIHSPYMKLNIWYLNYHSIAAVLDLGLQRNITTSSGVSLLEQEMRTRIFWVVFMLDRTIATIMGRPIGLRDEACELRVSSPKVLYDLIY
jgi:hypothetical protein